MGRENIWAWLQVNGRIFKVISDAEKGIIEVFDDNGELLIRKINLTREQVHLVEQNFLHHVAKKLNNNQPVPSKQNQDVTFDPMVG
ncbi:MAG: hypothetical protein QXX20_05840 [Candidatus Thermoplasmatota archaeon]